MNDIVHCAFCGCGGEAVYQSANDAEGCIWRREAMTRWPEGVSDWRPPLEPYNGGPEVWAEILAQHPRGTEMPQQPAHTAEQCRTKNSRCYSRGESNNSSS
jgi:hypothetical protein